MSLQKHGLGLQEWPDVLHIAVLRHLGGAQQFDGYLRPYSELCRATLAAVHSPQLWHSIDFSSCHQRRGITNDGIVTIISRFSLGVTERLNFRGLEIDDETLTRLTALLAGGPLRSIDLGTCSRLSGAVITSLGSIGTLEEIGVECVTTFEDVHLASLCFSCPRLIRLDVRYCEWLTDATALLGPDGSRPWSVLQLDGCFRLDVERLLLAGRSGVWQSLQELSIDGEDLPSEQFSAIAERCPSLRHLAVSFARDLEPTGVRALSSLPWLEHLILKKGTIPSDGSWAALFSQQYASRLAFAPNSCVGAWRVLNFAECELFADGAAASLAASSLPLLLELDLSWCWHLTDEGLRLALSAAPGLQTLKLAGIKGVTGSGLLPCCRMIGLEELDCTSCNSVQDAVLEFLHRLFAAAPGLDQGDCLPCSAAMPSRVAEMARSLWVQRRRGSARLRIKNYYAEYLEDWAQLRPPQDVCAAVELLLIALEGSSVEREDAWDARQLSFAQ